LPRFLVILRAFDHRLLTPDLNTGTNAGEASWLVPTGNGRGDFDSEQGGVGGPDVNSSGLASRGVERDHGAVGVAPRPGPVAVVQEGRGFAGGSIIAQLGSAQLGEVGSERTDGDHPDPIVGGDVLDREELVGCGVGQDPAKVMEAVNEVTWSASPGSGVGNGYIPISRRNADGSVVAEVIQSTGLTHHLERNSQARPRLIIASFVLIRKCFALPSLALDSSPLFSDPVRRSVVDRLLA
jgi:hypothetical protein